MLNAFVVVVYQLIIFKDILKLKKHDKLFRELNDLSNAYIIDLMEFMDENKQLFPYGKYLILCNDIKNC